ncbi:hypothetical protein Dthio_PD3662 [Desulfonatronospira thiodismutans ASO3-1]|uniref:Uncharacterized protein n=1 Tax=Desulfonatronospira thiodismutans ASO3-1 TaxID=555779 RepID=D6SK02_9BACT|nr:hypothetical protein Dthio_PD3662 [Desulfonatronospira thiodismutans ASO3-1]
MLGGLLGLFHESEKNDHFLPDDKAIKCTSNAFASPRPQFEKSASHAARVRHAQARPKLDQKFNQSRVVGKDANRPVFNLISDLGVEILNRAEYC